MSKWSKLYQQLLSNPNMIVRFGDLEGLLRAFGFVHLRTKGSHKSYRHPMVPDILTVQPRGKDAVSYQVQRLLELIRAYDLHMSG